MVIVVAGVGVGVGVVVVAVVVVFRSIDSRCGSGGCDSVNH